MRVVQLSIEGGHFTSAEKVGDDTRRVKYLRKMLELRKVCCKEPHLRSYFQGLSLHREECIHFIYLENKRALFIK